MATIQDKWPWPANVGVLGTFAEEVKETQRRVEKNINASPLPAAEPTNLLNPSRSSETLRIGEPGSVADPGSDAAFTPAHVVIRRVLSKARQRAAILFDEAIDSEDLADLPRGRRDQMKTMSSREQAMLEILDRYNALAEDVYMRLLSGAKG